MPWDVIDLAPFDWCPRIPRFRLRVSHYFSFEFSQLPLKRETKSHNLSARRGTKSSICGRKTRIAHPYRYDIAIFCDVSPLVTMLFLFFIRVLPTLVPMWHNHPHISHKIDMRMYCYRGGHKLPYIPTWNIKRSLRHDAMPVFHSRSPNSRSNV